MEECIDLAAYLFVRLKQIGVDSVHGVPGDYNLVALDYLEPAGLHWVGNANELNAGYAADGYGRIKGISALMTAFGVGELSAINAIGGAYAEMSPVVHVVGTPPTRAQNAGLTLHHSLGDGNFRVFANCYKNFTVAQANLTDLKTAPGMIDHALRECVIQSRPVYIELPTDMVKQKVPAYLLRRPIDLSIPENDEGFEDAEVELILAKIYASKQPFIIVDGFTSRLGITQEIDELVRVTGFPTSTTTFGKGIINETYPNFHGIYAGEAGKQKYRPWVDSCDLVLRIGPLSSDTNTYGFSTIPKAKVSIDFHRDSVVIGGSNSFSNVHIKPLLRKILKRLDKSRLPRYDPYPDLGNPQRELDSLPPIQDSESACIDQDTFWQRISPFFRPGDIICTETGTPAMGGRDFVLPPYTTLLNSGIWLSIGFMLPAAQGAALAQRDCMALTIDSPLDPTSQSTTNSSSNSTSETNTTSMPTRTCRQSKAPLLISPHHATALRGRTILFIGDGSFQMTAQSLSDTIHHRLPLIIFLLNNAGYTIERWIHGMHASYNDVAPWRYLSTPYTFSAHANEANTNYPIVTRRADTWASLWRVLDDSAVANACGKGLVFIEVIMGKFDAPESLKKVVESAARRNRGGPSTSAGGEASVNGNGTGFEAPVEAAG